jgi:hypothetical protein
MATSTLNKNVTASFILQQEQLIERAFVILKGRVRRLHFIETKEMQTFCEILISCGVLHNIYINQGGYGQEFLEDVQENINVINVRDNDNTD